MEKMYYYFITMLFCITLVSAYNYQTIYNPFTSKLDYHITSNMSGENITADYIFANGSQLNVNNSQHFQDYTPTTLKSWIQNAFNSVYCLLTGCTMSGDLDMGDNNITNVSYLGVGTTDPQRPIHLVGNGSADSGQARFGISTTEYTEIGHRGNNGAINTVGDGDLDFRHDGVNKMSLSDTGNLDVAGNLTNTNSWFLGKTAWATIQDKFITAVDDLYIYMSETTATLNETKLNATIDNRAVTTETDPYWTANQSSYFTKANINSFGYYNSSNFVISNYYTKINIDGFNFWNDTFATFNKTYADGLYADISVSDTNETTRFNTLVGTDCGAGNYSYGFDSNGLIQCREDVDTNTQLSDADILGLGYNHTTDIQTWVNANDDTGTDTQDLSYNTTTDVISLVNGGSIDITEVDTSANTICSGGTTYLDGDGNCDDISGVYIDETDEGNLNVNHSTTSGTATTWNGETSQANLNVNSSAYWDGLNSPSDINAADITDDGTYRLNSWDNLTGIPHATPTNADVTHFSLSDEIYDFVIALGYATTTYVDNLVATYTHLSNYTDDLGDRGYTSNSNFSNDEGYTTNTGTVTSIATTAPIAGGTITTTGTLSLTACANTEIYKYNSTSGAWECESDAGQTYTGGDGIIITGSEINHTDTSSQASSENSGNTFIQDIILDTFGHITSIVTSGVDFSSYTATSGLVAILGNWSADKSSYWDTSTDLDTVISDDEITEGKIAFSTACGAGNHYYLNGNDLACEADDDTTYTAGNGIALAAGAFSVAGNTALTQNADGLSVTADGIGDTQLAYNTGQHLTTTGTPQFARLGIGVAADGTEKLLVAGNIFLQNDSDKIYFGQSKDVSFKFDGSDFVFTGEVGSPQFKVGGNLNITGQNMTNTNCIIFSSGGKICSGS